MQTFQPFRFVRRRIIPSDRGKSPGPILLQNRTTEKLSSKTVEWKTQRQIALGHTAYKAVNGRFVVGKLVVNEVVSHRPNDRKVWQRRRPVNKYSGSARSKSAVDDEVFQIPPRRRSEL